MEKKLNFKVCGLPAKYFIPFFIIVMATVYLGFMPVVKIYSNDAGKYMATSFIMTIAYLMAVGGLFFGLGNTIPIVNNYLGGACLLPLIGASFLNYVGLVPQELVNGVKVLMGGGFQDAYRAYVLDYFSESNGRSYNGIEKFVSNAFEAYPELEQVELLSYSTKKQFLFLSQEVVYPYRDGEARLREIQEGTWKKKEGELTYIKEIINPSTMKQEGCMIFTFSVKQHLQKISESRSWADLLVMEEDGEMVYSSFEQKEDKWRQEQSDELVKEAEAATQKTAI